MKIQNINQSNQTFTALSERNNYYESTNAGKFIGLGISAGGIAERIMTHGGFKGFADSYKRDVATALGEEFHNASGQNLTITTPSTAAFKNIARQNLIGSVALFAGCCIGAGLIFDEIVNAQRSSRADGHHF